jgi:uncharacterized protein (TIGR02145 family)
MKILRYLFLILIFPATLCLLPGCKKDKEGSEANPPVVASADVTIIRINTACSGGMITNDGGSTVTARGVVWSEHDLPTTEDNKSIDGSGAGSFLSYLTGLKPGCTYYLRAYATNAGGTSYGSTMVFATISDTFTDIRDGYIYHAVQIGNQIWMKENLRYLPSVVGPDVSSFLDPCYYVYDYSGTNVSVAKATPNYTTFGVLYNWPAARIAAPEGWHLPSDQEWKTLEMTLGMSQIQADASGVRGTDQGAAIAGNESLWMAGLLTSDPAFGSAGLDVLPGGFYRAVDQAFYNMGVTASFWTSDEIDNSTTWKRELNRNSPGIIRGEINKNIGFSLRCILTVTAK